MSRECHLGANCRWSFPGRWHLPPILLHYGSKSRTMLGQASVTVTLDTYTHLIETQQEDVADRMQEVLGGVG